MGSPEPPELFDTAASERGTSAGRWRTALRGVGPELISAASDNDPTNVGTAALVGAQTGYRLSWVALLVAPLLGVVQAIAAQLGAVTRSDLQSVTVQRYGRRVAVLLLVTVVVVNVVTIAADLQAGAAGLGLLVGVDQRWLVVPFGLAVGTLLVLGRYGQVVGVVRYLLVGFLAFGLAALLAHPHWPSLLRGSLVPSLSLHGEELSGALALVGTTLTAYVYMWETVARGVEERVLPPGGLRRIKAGAVVGAGFTALVLWFMVVASAATLGRTRQPVTSAADAARALRPLAGSAAADLFALGLVASALVALPILLATTAYVVGAHFGWRRGLSEGIGAAPGFYAAIAVSLGLALAVTLAHLSVITMLVVASVAGGLGTPLGLVLLVLLARDVSTMGSGRISRRLAAAGWAVASVIGGLGILFVGALTGWF
ncbi:MAG TPA: divalent metal cation transporter [Acidimicrobiales bacterium]|jgi:Mn2+/Fe2+ NRAMP family transporter|nr:divalent metal cation transporter [Acidimicrobiales bacterium]